MDRTGVYYKQVQLLVQLLPLVAEETCFALKGGTAINLFVRNLPRLSVDIDLVFLPMSHRDKALDDITLALLRISKRIADTLPNVTVIEAFKDKPDALRIIIERNNVKVKIELSPVLRARSMRLRFKRFVTKLKMSLVMLKCALWHYQIFTLEKSVLHSIANIPETYMMLNVYLRMKA